MIRFLLAVSGLFYAVLCVFSIVTGLLYATGRRKLNPIELSDIIMDRLDDPHKRAVFTRRMGWVTVVIGIIQGMTAWCFFSHRGGFAYGIAFGFTIFSIASVSAKLLRGRFSTFAATKLVLYICILIILILPSARPVFFG